MKALPERAATFELNRRRIGSVSGWRFGKVSQDTKGPALLNYRWLRGCTSVTNRLSRRCVQPWLDHQLRLNPLGKIGVRARIEHARMSENLQPLATRIVH